MASLLNSLPTVVLSADNHCQPVWHSENRLERFLEKSNFEKKVGKRQQKYEQLPSMGYLNRLVDQAKMRGFHARIQRGAGVQTPLENYKI